MNIALTSVYVNDPMAAFTFYTTTLGFVERLLMPEANLAIVASADEPGGTGLLLEPNDNPIASTYQAALYQAGFPVIVLGVADMAAEHARLVERGVRFTTPPTVTPAGIEAIFDDTCGNLIQLFQA